MKILLFGSCGVRGGVIIVLCAGTVSDGETMHVISVRCGRGGLMTSRAGILITVPVSLGADSALSSCLLFICFQL